MARSEEPEYDSAGFAAPESEQPYIYDEPDEHAYQSAPAYNYQNPEKDPEAVMGTGEFFFSLLLMNIPLLGLIMQIVWSCGGTRKRNLVNLARAVLIFTVLFSAIVAVLLFYFWDALSILLSASMQ